MIVRNHRENDTDAQKNRTQGYPDEPTKRSERIARDTTARQKSLSQDGKEGSEQK